MKDFDSKRFLIKHLLVSAVAALVGTTPIPSLAQSAYPSKPIRIVIPFPAGGAIDTLVRVISPELTAQLGQPIIILNKPGGGSQLAAMEITSAPADGYTIFVAQGGDFSVNPTLYKKINYIPARDFSGVAMLVRTPQVMLANVGGKINSAASLKETMAGVGTIDYGSMGPGTAPHLLGHMLSKSATGARFTHVPYKGFPPAMQALVSGQVDLLFDGIPGAINMIKTGKVTPIAIAAPQRSSYFPDVPTTAEIGYPSLVMDFWIGVAARKGTPAPILNRLHDAFEKAVSHPDNWKRFADLGYSRAPMNPEQFDAYIRAETERYRPLIVDTGVVVD